MSHISTASSNGRILHPDIPPPSVNAEHHPPPHSAPLALVPGESMGMGKGNTSPRGLWFFKKPNHNRTGSRSSTPSKLGRSPLMERSLSEPNSPTEPTSASAFYERAGTRPNYISKALELLDSSTVRFAGHEDDLSKFYDRYHKLFANGQPINGKIVRRDTPKPNAQDVARLLVRDIEAKLEEMDREMEILESDDSSSSAKASASKRSPRRGVKMIHASTPELVSGSPLKPWFDPSTINPVVLDKVNKRRSVNPEGTWHGHTRTRSATLPRPLPDFAAHSARNLDFDRNQNANLQPPSMIPRNGYDDLPKEDQDQTKAKEQDGAKDREREREKDKEKDKGKGKSKEGERDKTRDKPHDSDGEKRREKDTGLRRRERYRPRRENIPPHLNLPPQLEYVQRGRQTSDPAMYTRAAFRRGDSPESLPPAVYTLAEDVEVRSGSSSAATTRNPAAVGVPRVPTVVAYPGDEEEELAAVYGNKNGANGRGGPTALSPIAEANPPAGPTGQSVNETRPRRRRSRSLGHELDGRASRNRPRSRSPKRDRARERDREREKPRDKEDRERDRDKEREKERERDRDREKEKERERDREKDRERDRQRDKDRDRDRERDKAKDRDRDRNRDRGDNREREKDRSREKDRDREREKEKDRYGSARPKHEGDGEREREQLDSGNRDNRDRDRDKDKNRDRNRDRGREEDRRKEKDKNKDRERERDRDRDQDRDWSKDRNKDYNSRSERDRLVNPSTTEVAPVAQIPPPSPNMPGAFGPIPPGFIPPPTRSVPSPGLVPPPPHHAMLKFGVPMNGPLPPNPNSESRFMEILTSPAPPMPYDLPRLI